MICAKTWGRESMSAKDCSASPHDLREVATGSSPSSSPTRRLNPPQHDPQQQQQDAWKMSCHQQTAPPQRDTVKMSPHISLCPETVLAAHAPSPPAAGRHDRPEKTQLPIFYCVVVGGQFGGGLPSVFQDSLSMLARLLTRGGAVAGRYIRKKHE